jgi:hypothetical protein
VSDIARMVHPGKRGHKIVAVLQFKFDESYNHRFMAVGGWIGTEQEWKRLESAWQKRIDFENAHNSADQQIERFHASPLNARDNEFEHWTQEMSIAFSKKLVGIIGKRRLGAICIASDIDALKKVFPDGPENRRERAYVLCIKWMMIEITRIMQDYFPNEQVLLIHDHGDWDIAALNAYNQMIDDSRWENRKFFAGVVPLTGKQSVGLQAADLIAYEIFKGVKLNGRLHKDDMRKAFNALHRKQVPLGARFVDERTAIALREIMEGSTKYDD